MRSSYCELKTALAAPRAAAVHGPDQRRVRRVRSLLPLLQPSGLVPGVVHTRRQVGERLRVCGVRLAVRHVLWAGHVGLPQLYLGQRVLPVG